MIVLYEHPLSPFAQKVKMALYEKDVEFESRLPDLFGGSDEGFNSANPRREVPALVVDEETAIFDSTIILEYIEESWPNPPLLPREPEERARLRMLEEVCDTYYEAINWGVFEVRFFARATGDKAEEILTRAAQQTAGVNTYLERHLGAAPYFNGAVFGWGDLSVLPLVFAASFTGRPPAAGSRLAAWLERASAQPSAAKTMQQASEAMGAFELVPQLVASGQFVREYRDHRLEWMMRSGGVDIVLDGIKNKNIRFSHELE